MAKVFLSAGHGGSDPGAVGNGLTEENINLQIMLACRDELVRHGVTVVCSRTTDVNDPVQDEVKEANASGADIAVSFHTNAGGGNGSESFYHKGSSLGKKLAELCEKYIKALGQNSRGVKTNNLMFTRATKMPAVLCECAFIDTKSDISIVDTTAEQKAFGVAYAKAILEYFGIAHKAAGKAEAPAKQPVKTPATSNVAESYVVRVTADVLNVRDGAGTNYRVNTTVNKGEAYTILSEKVVGSQKWGELMSGVGWICLSYTEKVTAKAKATKSVDEVAREVINGKWGNGSDRKARLITAGYDYNAVQKRVNELLK